MGIVDYGLGNLDSVARAIAHVGGACRIISRGEDLLDFDRLILPGVGAFGTAMANLNAGGLAEPLKAYADSGRPILGLCLGMQLFMDESDELGLYRGLGLIPGKVLRFHSPSGTRYKIPHVGWSSLDPAGVNWSGTLLSGLESGDRVYFVHSHYVSPDLQKSQLALTNYCDHNFCSVIAQGNIYGCQFHPEKSGPTGLKILSNFMALK